MQRFIAALGERSFGLILLLMAFPNALLIATIPGLSTLFGTVMALTSIQMILRLPNIWLPSTLKDKPHPKEQLAKVIHKSSVFLKNIEKFLKPRILILTTPLFEGILGVISLINSLLIALPIPFGNFLPGIAMVILSLGIAMRDGIFVMAGISLSLAVWFSLFFMYHSFLSTALQWAGL